MPVHLIIPLSKLVNVMMILNNIYLCWQLGGIIPYQRDVILLSKFGVASFSFCLFLEIFKPLIAWLFVNLCIQEKACYGWMILNAT